MYDHWFRVPCAHNNVVPMCDHNLKCSKPLFAASPVTMFERKLAMLHFRSVTESNCDELGKTTIASVHSTKFYPHKVPEERIPTCATGPQTSGILGLSHIAVFDTVHNIKNQFPS
jgi:hypothetical protein